MQYDWTTLRRERETSAPTSSWRFVFRHGNLALVHLGNSLFDDLDEPETENERLMKHSQATGFLLERRSQAKAEEGDDIFARIQSWINDELHVRCHCQELSQLKSIKDFTGELV